MFARVRAPIDYTMYPVSDGKPMAESEVHRVQMNDLIFTCVNLLADEPEVYVGGNMLMYYHEGSGRDHVSADVFVTFGVERWIRECWMTWEEHGRFADLVFEISSPSTIKEDLGKKMRLYAQLGVIEYYLYDPRRENQPPLAGYRLVEGAYQPMTRLVGVEGYYSEVLGAELRVVNGRLRVIDPATGEPLLVPSELDAVRARAEAARELAEAAWKAAEERAEYETAAHTAADERRQAAEQRAAHEAASRQAAEDARQATEAALREALEEIARLRAAAEQG
ncbi:MAG: Uma2 family endonuclease [Chloroflexota bacterium]